MRRALSFFGATLVMLVSAKASASYHFMKVVEVYAGSAANPNACYVQLQMYAPAQNFVGGHVLRVYDAAGLEIAASSVTLSGNVANGSDQANILIGTASVAATFGVAPDFTLPANLSQAGGAVCFDGPPVVDCFSWGSFAGAAADGTVTPFAPLNADKAARRSIAAGASAVLLEDADDGNNSALDFTAEDPAPKNNLGGAGGLDGGTPPKDSGVPDSAVPPKDSGIGTTPSPNNPTATPDASTPTGSRPIDDDSGCSFVAHPSDGWSTALGLFVAASILVMSRRRRTKR